MAGASLENPLQLFGRQEMTIPADLSRLAEVRLFAERACRAYGFSDEACYQVKLAMSEAVANAIEHGSTTPDDPIRLQVVEEGDALAFYVSDGGTFINPEMLYDHDTMDERGRGLGFIELLMDDVAINPSPEGTVIRFSKRIGTRARSG
jgi:anti-sigma regulatory factor (Ser/Thr protein kinase)